MKTKFLLAAVLVLTLAAGSVSAETAYKATTFASAKNNIHHPHRHHHRHHHHHHIVRR